MILDQYRPVLVLVPGDLHLTLPDLDNVTTAHWIVDEANDLIQPDFVQFIGDNVQDATAEQFALFYRIRARLTVPQFALVGDHDVHDDPSAARFGRHVGDTYGATSLRGFRFFRLNTQEARPVGISREQLDWFRAEVDHAGARRERIVVFQHNYPYQVWEDFAGPGIDDWRAVMQTRRIEGVVCGHTHYWQVANDGRNVFIATRSVGDPEGGAPGYTLLYFQGDDLAATFRSTADRGPIVLITHPRDSLLATSSRHIVTGLDQIAARVWSRTPVNSVRARIDHGAWVRLGAASDGLWHGPLASNALDKGQHVLEVGALSADGAHGLAAISFMVDPTGRFTAVPQVRPLVESTAFC